MEDRQRERKSSQKKRAGLESVQPVMSHRTANPRLVLFQKRECDGTGFSILSIEFLAASLLCCLHLKLEET